MMYQEAAVISRATGPTSVPVLRGFRPKIQKLRVRLSVRVGGRTLVFDTPSAPLY